ncbi:Crp/Fnr family transcriptional regulator [Nostoc sp.]|uniref:Crp/Fnr family transcriptional regulator n=1 Tax=Nostoc sp. TaxID=1180 RepID=UPI002FF78B11
MNFLELDQLPTALQAVVTHQHLSNGQILYHRNEAVRSIYVVRSGRIRLLHYTQEGEAISRYTIHVGEVCAEIALFLDAHTCSAIAEEPTQVLVFPKQVFLNELQQNLDFATAFMAQMSYRLHVTKEMVVLRSISSARERILHYLHLIMPPEQNTVVLEQPLKSIAYELGISPEVFSRTLTRLERDGVIAREKRKITLLALLVQL